jgi:hypothetical protein
LIAGIRWQYEWIHYTSEIHSGLLDRRVNKNSDTNNEEELKPVEKTTNSTSEHMFISEVVQLGMFILGLILFAIYKSP